MAKKVEEIIKIVEEYEAKLRAKGTLSTKIDLKLSKKSLQDFFIDFFYYNHLAHNDTLCPITGFNGTYTANSEGVIQNGANVQCTTRRRRSIGDLFQIALAHYSKEITLMECMEAVMNIINNETPIVSKDNKYKFQMYTCVCSTIHRRVFNATTYGGKGTYRFNGSNSEINTGAETSYDEFAVVLPDYLTLESAGIFKSYRETKDKDRAKRKVVISQTEDELDRLVKAKLAELLSGNSDKLDIVKPVKKKILKK